MLFKAEVKVMPKKAVLDPQGSAVEGAVKTLGYTGVGGVRIGKVVELEVEAADEEQARRIVDELGRKILSNPVMETYSFDLTAHGSEVK